MKLEGFKVDPATKAVIREDGSTNPLRLLSRKIKGLESKIKILEERLEKLELELVKNLTE